MDLRKGEVSEDDIAQRPWRTGVYEQPSELEGEPSRTEEPRRSTRIKRPNPKYANAAITKKDDAIEPETFEEAQLSLEWNKSMEEEFATLE
jgi:hypothetical protein